MRNQHLHNPHRTLAPIALGPSDAPAIAILLHGRDRDPADIIAIAQRLALPRFAYLALVADQKTWYPNSFLAARKDNQPRLGFALEALHAAVEALQRPANEIAFVGFSQGACLASEYVYRNPKKWGALISFTGGLFGPPQTTWPTRPLLARMPVFLSNGDHDPFVPLWRVQETADVFRAMDGEVECVIYPGRDHLVSDDEITRSRKCLAAMLPRDGRSDGGDHTNAAGDSPTPRRSP